MSNSVDFPEAWDFFDKYAIRVFEGTELRKKGKYAVPHPTKENEWISADCTGVLFLRLREEFYKPNLNSPSVYGKVQAIVEHFSG